MKIEKILNYLKDNIAVYKGNVSIYEAIIKELNHHRSFPTAQWALSPADIELLENLKMILHHKIHKINIFGCFQMHIWMCLK